MGLEHEHTFVEGLVIAIEECTEVQLFWVWGGKPTTNKSGAICNVCGQVDGEPEGTIDTKFKFVLEKEAQFKKLPK